jgi:tetratricopeptide (TPR) repeat protein
MILAALAGGLLLGGAARAGVYNLNDSPNLPTNFTELRLLLGQLRVAQATDAPDQPKEQDTTLRVRYLDEAAALGRKEREGSLTTIDRINLGACNIRLGRPNDAIRVLEAGDHDNFLILANLAAAYHAAGQLNRAVSFQEQALDAWPELLAGWTKAQLNWYRRVDRFYLKLLRLRQAEERDNPGRFQWEAVDALFDKVKYVGPGGKFEAGKLARGGEDELPPDALNVLIQLMVWLPADDRLYWQLGDLINSLGDVPTAYSILDDLVFNRGHTDKQELQRQRGVLNAAKTEYAEVAKELQKPKDGAFLLTELLGAFRPRGMLATPGVGGAAEECGLATALHSAVNDSIPTTPAEPPRPPTAQPATSARPWLPDWQTVVVGFVAGLIVAVLGGLQWMEWRRRRALAALRPGAAEDAPALSPTEAQSDDAGAVRADAPAGDRLEGAP